MLGGQKYIPFKLKQPEDPFFINICKGAEDTFLVNIWTEVGKVTLKSNGDEALSDEFLLKRNGDEALNDVFSIKSNGDEAFNAKKKLQR